MEIMTQHKNCFSDKITYDLRVDKDDVLLLEYLLIFEAIINKDRKSEKFKSDLENMSNVIAELKAEYQKIEEH